MQKGPIYISISRVLAGDTSANNAALDKLCRQLADRTVFVPTKESTEGLVTRTPTPVQVLRIVDNKGRSLVPVFLQQNTLADWCQHEGLAENSISLLGADICVAMAGDSWIILEPNTENELKLEPKIVELISKVGQDQEIEVSPQNVAPTPPQASRSKVIYRDQSSKLTPELIVAEKRSESVKLPAQKSKGLFGFFKGLRA